MKEKKININDKVPITKISQNVQNYTAEISNENNNLIRVLQGPQFNYFSKTSKKEFFSKKL